MSYRELDQNARRVANWLRANTSAGERAILLFPPGPQFAVGFLGCLYAGVIAVPAPLPAGGSRGLAQSQGLTVDAQARVILTESGFVGTVHDWVDHRLLPAHIRYAATDRLPDRPMSDWEPGKLSSDAIAFLQYTSGSTRIPRGVMVTHGNLLHNQRLMQHALGTDRNTSLVGWLPHYHDMGLIGQLLHALYVGGTTHFMSPMTFLLRPHWWLWAISKYRATVSVAPNFAFELATRRITDEQLAEFDLSSLQVLCNGSEPIQHDVLRAFTERFRRAGLKERAVLPCYGLAESTLFVTGTGTRGAVTRTIDPAALERDELRQATKTTNSSVLVSSGRTTTVTTRIVDPDSHEVLPERRVGEIWLRGGSVAAGYWNRPEESEQTFRASTADGELGFLRTGDLGVIDDGELFVVGRLKEMLIVNGRNLYPTDIEHAAHQAHPALEGGRAAAFAVGGRGEQLVLVHEISAARLRETPADELIGLVRQKVRAELGVYLAHVLLVRNGAVAKTTSGKVQRRLMRERFLAGQLKALPVTGEQAPIGKAPVAR